MSYYKFLLYYKIILNISISLQISHVQINSYFFILLFLNLLIIINWSNLLVLLPLWLTLTINLVWVYLTRIVREEIFNKRIRKGHKCASQLWIQPLSSFLYIQPCDWLPYKDLYTALSMLTHRWNVSLETLSETIDIRLSLPSWIFPNFFNIIPFILL